MFEYLNLNNLLRKTQKVTKKFQKRPIRSYWNSVIGVEVTIASKCFSFSLFPGVDYMHPDLIRNYVSLRFLKSAILGLFFVYFKSVQTSIQQIKCEETSI